MVAAPERKQSSIRAAQIGGMNNMDPYPSIVIFLLLILLSSLLTAGRTALTQLRDSSVKKMASSERGGERFIARLLERPAAFLDGVELARFACTVAAALFTYPLALVPLTWLVRSLSFSRPLYYAFSFVGFLLTVLLLNVLCALLPYRVACRHPEGVSAALARLCWFVACVMRPFVLLNGVLARGLARLFGVRAGEEPEEATEEEIRMMVDVGSEKGAIEQSEKDMINNIFEFDDRSVSEVMTHRTDMTAVPKTASLEEIADLAVETGFSRIPVYDDDIDDIMGIIYVKDLLRLIGKGEDAAFDAQKYMRPALFVPENMSCVDLFAQFKQKKVMVAVAVDEYGGTAGIVSMEDLLESIVGNIQDEYDDEEEEISQLSDNCWSIDGTVAIDDVERLFDVEFDEDTDYDTIGGLITEALGRLPEPGEHPSVQLEGVQFTVLLVEERRIARIRAERLPPEEPPEREKDKKEKN